MYVSKKERKMENKKEPGKRELKTDIQKEGLTEG